MVKLTLSWDRAQTISLLISVEYSGSSLAVGEELLLWESRK